MPSLETIAREDLALFVNACTVGTGQREFYSAESAQQVSLEFLHAYICGNYRRLYAHCLALSLTHHARLEIVRRLLSSGKAVPPEQRREEGPLIRATLKKLPPQRVWKLFERLRAERVNNRRTRATLRDFVAGQRDLTFQAVKYRAKLRSSVLHAHLRLSGELPEFLFGGKPRYQTPLLEAYRAAQYSAEALYNLPYSIAEGFAERHGVDRQKFLRRIAPKMTEREKLRLHASSGGAVAFDPLKVSLSELCVYLLSLPLEERWKRQDELEGWLAAATRKAGPLLEGLPLSGKVAAVLDSSYSSSGSSQKRNRPLALAWATHRLLASSGAEYRPFWTRAPYRDLLLHPRGQTNLAERLLDALEWGAQTVVIVSDAVENDPPGAFAALLDGYRTFGGSAELLHLNPVFDPETLTVRRLHPDLPALGLRSSEDLPALLGFARFLSGGSTLADLEAHLETRVRLLLKDREEDREEGEGKVEE